MTQKARSTPLGILVGALWLCGAAHGTPFTPAHDDTVLERLPREVGTSGRELRPLREALAQSPDDPALASRLAWRYIEAGRTLSDPRFYGYAEGALATWWHHAEPPTEVLLVRATLRQNRHEFGAALQDLGQLLTRDPLDARAWLTQAIVHQVQGAYAQARSSCMPLFRLSDPLVASTCLAGAASHAGKAPQSFDLLDRALEAAPRAPVETRLWSLTTLAEIAVRLGRNADAESAYRRALALGRVDTYLLASYADFLLDEGELRAAEVLSLVEGRERNDNLLLRRALAERALGMPRLTATTAMLRDRFAAARARGDSTHLGEEARFRLHLEDEPLVALELALTNWTMQREPRDAEILMAAAIAAQAPDAAQPVLDWLGRSELEDVRLERLRARLERLGARLSVQVP